MEPLVVFGLVLVGLDILQAIRDWWNMPIDVQERPELETTMSTYPKGQVAFTLKGMAVRIVGGDTADRLRAYWHMASSDRDFWDMVNTVPEEDVSDQYVTKTDE